MSARQETTLIYSSGGNKQYAEIASSCGFELGSQLPSTLYAPIYFADQDDKKPNRKAYMNALALHKPHMATVLDWKLLEQFSTIMDWAEEASQWAEVIIVIPKVHNQMHRIPKRINGKEVRIGYSVPTSHGGTEVMLWEFSGREVHLLGGSPHCQLLLSQYLNVVSVDSNYIQKMALKGMFWVNRKIPHARNKYFPTLGEADRQRWNGENMPAEAIKRSLTNIMTAWRERR